MAAMMVPVVMAVMVMFMHLDAGTNATHALLVDVFDYDFKRIDIERLQLFVQFTDRNTQPNQRTEDHIAARPANAFKMQYLFAHDAGQHGRFLNARQACSRNLNCVPTNRI